MAKSPGWTRVKQKNKKARWKKGKSYFKGSPRKMRKKTARGLFGLIFNKGTFLLIIIFILVMVIMYYF